MCILDPPASRLPSIFIFRILVKDYYKKKSGYLDLVIFFPSLFFSCFNIYIES